MYNLKQSESLAVAMKLDPATRIATMTLSGVLTESTLRWYCNEALPRGIAGYVTRAHRLIVAVESAAAKTVQVRPDLALVPGAIVAPPGGVEFATEYARTLMRQGVLRKCFTSLSLADAWVRDQVELRSAHEHWRRLQFAGSIRRTADTEPAGQR